MSRDDPDNSSSETTEGELPTFVSRVLARALTAEGFTAIAAVFGTAALIAVALRFGVSPVVLALGVVLAILLAVLYICFTWVGRMGRQHRSLLAGILSYTVVITVSAALVMIFLSAFFNWPLPFRTWVVGNLGTSQDVQLASAENAKRSISRLGLSKSRPVSARQGRYHGRARWDEWGEAARSSRGGDFKGAMGSGALQPGGEGDDRTHR